VSPPASNGLDLSRRATESLRELIASGALSPGEQIRQTEVAERMGVSRSPLREALHALEQEGLLVHHPNRGYFVARLKHEDLTQLYRMRELLEGELIRSAHQPDENTLEELRSLNEEIATALNAGSVSRMLRSNRTFHFRIFDLSPLSLIRREAARLWRLCEPYQAAYLWHPETRLRVVDEHAAVIDALASGDCEGAALLLDTHRGAARDEVLRLLLPVDE
jgi:DNA-binding GntR family transcriptional regulator